MLPYFRHLHVEQFYLFIYIGVGHELYFHVEEVEQKSTLLFLNLICCFKSIMKIFSALLHCFMIDIKRSHSRLEQLLS